MFIVSLKNNIHFPILWRLLDHRAVDYNSDVTWRMEEWVWGVLQWNFFPGKKRWQRMFLTNRCQFDAAAYTIPTLPCRGFLLQSHNLLTSRGYASDYLKIDSISNSQQHCFKLSCGDWLKQTAWRPSDPGRHLHIWHLFHTLTSSNPLNTSFYHDSAPRKSNN